MLTQCLDLLKYEGADACEVHTNEREPVVFLHRPGSRMMEYAPVSPQRLAVLLEANRLNAMPVGPFCGPGVYHVTHEGALTYIP